MKTLALTFAVALTTCAAVLVGWHYQDQAGAVLAGAVIGAMCGWWIGFMAAVLTTRKPRPAGPPIVIDRIVSSEISPAALEWHRIAHGG